MDIKVAVTGKYSKIIVNSCEYGEELAKKLVKKHWKNAEENLNAE